MFTNEQIEKQFPGRWKHGARASDNNQRPARRSDDGLNNNAVGWVIPAIQAMVNSKAVAVAFQPRVNITIVNQSLQQHGYTNQKELVTAMVAACQGDGNKSVLTGALNANVSNIINGTAAPGFDVAAWRIRLTASMLNFAFRPIFVNVGPVLNTAGVWTCPNPVIRFIVLAERAPVDILVLSASNANGLATVVRGVSGETTATTTTTTRNGVVVESLGDANTFAMIESINARDLIAHPNGGQETASDAYASIHDMFGDNPRDMFGS